MTSDRWRPSPEVARAIEEYLRSSAWRTDGSTHDRDPPDASHRAVPEPETAATPVDSGHEACPELSVLTDLLGTAEAAHEVATLLVEVTREDIADLDRSLASHDLDRAALRMHRIVGGYQILGPSLLVDEGRTLLAELRTARSGATLARLSQFRDRLVSMMERIDTAVATQRERGLLRA